jgi:thiopurine S-methyltransferase
VGVDRWRESWRVGRTAFHRPEVHEDLIAHHDEVLGGARRVLVPLSGRSLDLAWLAERGHEVVGVEFVQEVVEAYVAERGLDAEAAPLGPFRAYASGRLTILAGDMMEATPELVGTFDGAWDRAALVALPPAERPRYAAVVRRLLAPGARMLLQTFACDRAPDVGPPYAVSEAEVRRLYPDADISLLGEPRGGPEGWPGVTYRLEIVAAAWEVTVADGLGPR